jgi:peptidoglycan/LPS O-acetylase OafA/YrhL
MHTSFSVYLDLVRFIAAVLVVVSHLAKINIFPEWFTSNAPDLGREAVVVFFVLSGYVIAFTKDKKKSNIDEYLQSRLVRIYSVAFPILLLSVILSYIGFHLDESLYSIGYQLSSLYIYLPLHLLFLGEVWTLSEQPFTVAPYWSLNYEFWYYILFAVMAYYRGWRSYLFIFIWTLFLGYKLLLLLPIWLSGVLLYKQVERFNITQQTALILFIISFFLFAAYDYYHLESLLSSLGIKIWPFNKLPLGGASFYLSDFYFCLIVLLNFYSAYHLKEWLFKHDVNLIRLLSSYTFTLYLIHSPIMIFFANHLSLENSPTINFLVATLLILAITILAAEITEKRKNIWIPIVAWSILWLKRCLKSNSLTKYIFKTKPNAI